MCHINHHPVAGGHRHGGRSAGGGVKHRRTQKEKYYEIRLHRLRLGVRRERRAPLLPKLRGHFAEFLNNASSVGLRILSSSTCVGLRYGYVYHNSGFSWHMAHTLPYFGSVHITSSDCKEDLLSLLLPRLYRFSLSRLVLSTCVPTVLGTHSTGISTCYPSTTSFDLALGPDLPRADQLYSGNLGYSAGRILTFLSLLIPAFSLLSTPLLLIGTASLR